jgi:hypothetical protein
MAERIQDDADERMDGKTALKWWIHRTSDMDSETKRPKEECSCRQKTEERKP